jgi:hypothetical protein
MFVLFKVFDVVVVRARASIVGENLARPPLAGAEAVQRLLDRPAKATAAENRGRFPLASRLSR